VPLFLLFLAISVKQDHTALRNGCATDSETLATVSAGAPLTIRFALSGEEVPCYKVAVEQNGKTVEGYLSASQIAGIDEFDQQRREAEWVSPAEVRNAMPSIAAKTGVAVEASHLIEASQPSKALLILQPELPKSRDPNLYALAGFAAWRADDAHLALDYWKTSLAMAPNASLQQIYSRVEREANGDQSTEKLIGMRVALRYDPSAVNVETARQMLAVLDQEFTRISTEIGCSAEERIVAIVQSHEAYRKTVDVAEWNAGQFDGRIRVPVVTGSGVDPSVRRVFAHETVHACLAMTGRWPAWFHEGLAQKLSGDTLNATTKVKIAEAAKDGKIPRLENLGQDWSRLDTAHALLAYAESLEAVDLFYENFAQLGIRNLIRNPDQLPALTSKLDARLGL
jgi:hypothetical protein